MASIPGITAKHAIITPECRISRGAEGAFDEAVRRLKAEYLAHHAGAWGAANCHLAFTVERHGDTGTRSQIV
jgi:hypothetical protein